MIFGDLTNVTDFSNLSVLRDVQKKLYPAWWKKYLFPENMPASV